MDTTPSESPPVATTGTPLICSSIKMAASLSALTSRSTHTTRVPMGGRGLRGSKTIGARTTHWTSRRLSARPCERNMEVVAVIQPRSIKQKLQWWVVVIFVLTGTAGWMGIWGLLYISRGSQSVTGDGVERAQRAGRLEVDLAAVRRSESAWLATSDASERRRLGAQWVSAFTSIGAAMDRLDASDAQARELRAVHVRALTALATTVQRVDAGEAFAAVQPGSFAEYGRAFAALENGTHAMTTRAFAAVSSQSDLLYGWIFRLQLGLFVTVLSCQLFSAWAGWELSRSVSAELNGLKESAEKISMGDLTTEVTVATSDTEIVALGEALDRLRVSLHKAMERLARKGPTARHPSGAPPAVQTEG